jgi:hypothetical protein
MERFIRFLARSCNEAAADDEKPATRFARLWRPPNSNEEREGGMAAM